MDTGEFVRTAAKRWTTVVGGVLLGLLVASAVLLTSDTLYRSTSQLFLSTPGWGGPTTLGNSDSSPYQGDEFTRQRAQTYVRLVEDMDFSQRVSDRMQGAVSADDISSHIGVRVVPDTVLLEVTAGDASPTVARDISVAATAQLSDDIERLETPAGLKVSTVQPVEVGSARVPSEPSSPHTALTLIAGVTVGLLAGLSLMVVRERSRRTADDPETIAVVSGRPVLASLSDASRDADFDEFRYNLEFLSPRVESGIVLVAGLGRGIGRTSTVHGLAAAYRRAGRSVVTVDADFRSDHRSSSDAGRGISNVVLGEIDLTRALTSSDGVAHLGSGIHPAEPARLLEDPRFAEVLTALSASYDIVIVDSSDLGRFDDARTVARLADVTVLVVASGRTTTPEITRSISELRAVGVDIAGTALTHSATKRARLGFVAPPDDQDTPTPAQTGTVTR
ncbi:polysaccharide biosynthesis tyrosine autokinase [Rhodococcus sp. MEB064]|uniref:polysaccharide biosynthesis tyrosine autokinase n=1 Tax=Rhodococcus sp. MEB064 TaxID=1587522 RepID=UPI0005ABEC6B|nr:polysaccharide biosynthesis tyrosine autokinase [Rhodococcus sp. MEB064]KIQ11795.1 hypothetical protein RU01_18550 [Rhodococcus sp. MEB064]